MFFLGLTLPICFLPGTIGASVPVQWVLLSAILPLGLWRLGSINPGHLAGLAVLAWSALSFAWSPSAYDSGYGMWLLAIWALSFWLGSTTTNLVPLWKGLAAGISISTAVAVAQYFGYSPVLIHSGYPGLLFNTTLAAATCALVIVALASAHLWLWLPMPILGLILANSRGAYLVLAATAALRFLPWTLVLTLIVAVGILLSITPSGSDTTRLVNWGMAIRGMTPWGNGIGSYSSLYYLFNQQIIRPERVHNDYLQLWYELGVGCIPLLGIYFLALRQRLSREWPVFVAFAIYGLFYFPLWAPTTAFIGCLVAGRLVADWHHNRCVSLYSRYDRLPRDRSARPDPNLPRSEAVPT